MTEHELANLPASQFGKTAIKRVSPIYDSSLFYKKFLDAIGGDADRIRFFFETLRRQRFIQTVDEWGIKYLENKYSVPVIKTDELEVRRARLGLKAWSHTPLNPAVLEKYAYDNHGLRVYLDESEAGLIGVCVNSFGANLNRFIKWLLAERPAHLLLKIILYWFSYVDSDSEFTLPDRVIKEPPLPRTHDDKANFPRLFAGNVLVKSGSETLPLAEPQPPALETKFFSGNLLIKQGTRRLVPNLSVPEMATNLFAGVKIARQGRKKISCAESSLKTLRGEIFSGSQIALTGRLKI